MCPGSTADPGNAEANVDDAAGSAEAIKVSYCRRSEGRFGCAWFRFRRCGSCSVQRATCATVLVLRHNLLLVAKLRWSGASTCFHSHFYYDTATSICFVARKQAGKVAGRERDGGLCHRMRRPR